MINDTADHFDINKINIEIDGECPVCKIVMNDNDIYKLNSCEHTFCRSCICRLLDTTTNTIKCPLCRADNIMDNREVMDLTTLPWASKLTFLIRAVGLFDIYTLSLCIFEIYINIKLRNFLDYDNISTWILFIILTSIDILTFLSVSGLLCLYQMKLINSRLQIVFNAITAILIFQSIGFVFVFSSLLTYYPPGIDTETAKQYMDRIRANAPEHWILMIVHLVTISVIFGLIFLEYIFYKQCLYRGGEADYNPSVYKILMSQKSTQR